MTNEVVEYNITDAAIAKMENLYMDLTVDGIDDKEGFESVRSGRMVVKGKRIEVEKKWKSYKVDSLAWGRKVDAEAKRIFTLLKPIEDHLVSQEEIITKEKERKKVENERIEQVLIKGRVESLFAVDVVMSFFDVGMLSTEDYKSLLKKSIIIYESKINLAEAERLAKEVEAEKLAEERAELEKMRAEQAGKAKIQREKEKALQAASDKLEADKKAEQERKYRESFEKKDTEDAAIQAEKDAKALVLMLAKEKERVEKPEIAEKKRQESLRPIKEKLNDYAFTIKNIIVPDTKDAAATEIIMTAVTSLQSIAEKVIKDAKEL